MEINTLIIGFIPHTDTTGKKFREVRDDKYFKELFSNYDLGTLHYVGRQDWKAKIDEINPLIIVYLGGEYYADEVKQYKKDAMLYAADDGGSIFYRKAQMEEKKEKNRKIFSEIERTVKKVREDGEKEIETIRRFSAMSYEDVYKMVTKAIISDNEELKKKAWGLLMNNDGHPNFVWMRVQLIVETWQAADAKQKEKLLNLAMADHIENGFARELTIHTDEEGIQYRQYEFLFPSGERSFYIRRIPIAPEGMDKYGYENLLDKYETPNGARMLLEVGQTKTEMKKFTDFEVEKICRVLKEWKVDPHKTQRELNVIAPDGVFYNTPLTEKQVGAFKKRLKNWGKNKYIELFPEENKN
jgi:ribosomal protein S20